MNPLQFLRRLRRLPLSIPIGAIESGTVDAYLEWDEGLSIPIGAIESCRRRSSGPATAALSIPIGAIESDLFGTVTLRPYDFQYQ